MWEALFSRRYSGETLIKCHELLAFRGQDVAPGVFCPSLTSSALGGHKRVRVGAVGIPQRHVREAVRL